MTIDKSIFEVKISNVIFVSLFIGLPKVGFIDLPVLVLAIYSLWRLVAYRNVNIPKTRDYILIYFLFGSLIILSFVSLIFNSSFSDTYTLRPLRTVVIFTLLLFIRSISILDIFYGLLCIAFLNAITVFIQFYFHYAGISELIFKPVGFFEDVITPYRKPGIFSGYSLSSLVQFFGAVASTYLFLKTQKKFFIFFLFVFFLSLILTGRTGLMFYFTFLILVPFLTSIGMKIRNFLIYLFSFHFIFLAVSIYLYNNDKYFSYTFEKAFALFFNYIEYGKFSDYSTEDLFENHYLLPEDLKTFFIGNSIQPFSPGGVESDVDFVRIIFTTGVFSLIIYIFLFFIIYFYAITFFLKHKQEGFFIIIILSYTFISVFKGPYLFSRVTGDLTMLIWSFLISYISRKPKKHQI